MPKPDPQNDPMCFTIPEGTHIEAVCARESSRYAIQGVYCDGPNKRLLATDGRAFVVLPVPDMPDGQPTVIIPVEAFKPFRANNGKRATHLKVTIEQTIVYTPNATLTFDNLDGSFPGPLDSVSDWKRPVDVHLSVNVDLLGDIARAFGQDVVHIGLRVDKDGRVQGPLLVVPSRGEAPAPDARAALMTVTMDDTKLPPVKPEEK